MALLKQRYDGNQIYTSINAMMLAINPYADLGLYAAPVVALYGRFGDGVTPPPHVFGVAAEAFKGVLAGGSQSILVAGESGAGKTESCRRVLQYLAHVGNQHASAEDPEAGELTRRAGGLHDELTRCNCVLEALGNARTTMNDNSSRFGKFLVLQYGAGSRLAGAAVSTYLLEKTRVVRHAPAERSFHIMYGLAAGLGAAEKAELLLRDPQQHVYTAVARAPPSAAPGAAARAAAYAKEEATRDLGTLAEVGEALRHVGLESFEQARDLGAISPDLGRPPLLTPRLICCDLARSPEAQAQAWRVLAAVLHLGDVRFGGDDAAEVAEGSLPALQAAAALLGSESLAALRHVLVTRCIKGTPTLGRRTSGSFAGQRRSATLSR